MNKSIIKDKEITGKLLIEQIKNGKEINNKKDLDILYNYLDNLKIGKDNYKELQNIFSPLINGSDGYEDYELLKFVTGKEAEDFIDNYREKELERDILTKKIEDDLLLKCKDYKNIAFESYDITEAEEYIEKYQVTKYLNWSYPEYYLLKFRTCEGFEVNFEGYGGSIESYHYSKVKNKDELGFKIEDFLKTHNEDLIKISKLKEVISDMEYYKVRKLDDKWISLSKSFIKKLNQVEKRTLLAEKKKKLKLQIAESKNKLQNKKIDNSKYYLLNTITNWADEMDITIFTLFTGKGYEKAITKASKLSKSIYFGIGSNQEIKLGENEIMDMLLNDTKEIKKSEYNAYKKLNITGIDISDVL